MVRMVAVKDATQTIITGHGISFPDRVEIAPGIFIEPDLHPNISLIMS